MDLIDRLAEHRTLQGAPREELAWLAEHSTLRTHEVGEVLTRKGGAAHSMFVVLSGVIALFIDRGSGPDKMLEWRSGDVAGVLPYSRIVSPPGDVVTQESAEILSLPREQLPTLIHECQTITGKLVHTMLDRARLFNSTELQNEKMISLGKLSAGLAHELNNPASAIERCAAQLEDQLEELEAGTRAMGQARLNEEQLSAVEAIRAVCLSKPASAPLTPLEQSDREDAIAEWLTAHRLDCRLACFLADTPVTLETLQQLTAAIPTAEAEGSQALNAVLRWAAAGCSVRILTSQIQDSAMRISSLVMAVKGFTHMDQAMVAQSVDLRQSLENTVVVLRAKARAKSVDVSVTAPADLLSVRGFAAELSQVWGNLLDNALDAVEPGGRIEVSARIEGERAVVTVADNGPGISKELMTRIFDPFFTTKPMGQGTGLGLDIVRRLLRHNNGLVEVASQPGTTEFRVSLPMA